MSVSRRRFVGAAAAAGLAPSLGALAGPAGAAGPGEAAATDGRSRRGPPPRRDDVLLGLVGDLFLREPQPAHPPGAGTRAAAEALEACDLVIANLENGLSTVGSPEAGGQRYGPSLRGPPSLVGELGRYHIDAVSLANNHTGNFGPEALFETMETLEGAGIRHAGAGADADAAFSAAALPAGGTRVGLISVYSLYQEIEADDLARPDRPGIAGCRAYDVVVSAERGLDLDGWGPDSDPPWVVPLRAHAGADGPRVILAAWREDLDRLADAIRRAREEVDFLIVSVHFHWGRHLRSDIPAQQDAFARAAVDAGADMVLGHGPHVLRGIEVHRGRPILYSIGNFLLGPSEAEAAGAGGAGADGAPEAVAPDRRSVILRVGLTGDRVRLELLPIRIGGDGRPRLGGDAFAGETLREIRGLSLPLGTAPTLADGVGELSLPARAAEA